MTRRASISLFLLASLFGFAWGGPGRVLAQASPDGSARAALSWRSIATDQQLAYQVYEPELPAASSAEQRPAVPLVIYLQNLAAPRIGTEDDETILRDLRSEGYLVVALDYAGHSRARVPFINRDLGQLRDDLLAHRFLAGRPIDLAHIYIVPAGCRLRRDVVYYRDGDRSLAFDLVYPARPSRPVGTVLEFSCDNQDRMGNYSLSVCSDTILDGQATEGFAVAMADHPVAAPYKGLDAMPDSAWKIKAAVRTLRAEGAALGLNGRIVPVGFSRGSGMALLLITTEGRSEFEGRGESPSESSAVHGAVVMSGRFTYLDLRADDPMIPRYAKAWGERATNLDVWRRHGALDYLASAPAMPLFLTINCTESPEALHQMTVLRRRLAELGADEIFLMDREPRGHKVTLDPFILAAMNRYLHERLGAR